MEKLSRVIHTSSSISNETLRQPVRALAVLGHRLLHSNFAEWKALGPGGAPHNLLGWMMQHWLDLTAGRETRRLDPYDKPLAGTISEEEQKLVQRRFLEDLPRRKGTAAKALPFCIPQRQGLAGSEPGMLEAQRRVLEDIAASNPSIVATRTSGLEKSGQAIYLAEGIPRPTVASRTAGEICHIHDSDGSVHVTLSNADGKEVLSKGWGERHRLSGTLLHLGYTMMYAPRDEEEVQIMGKLFKAGIAFMTGGMAVV